MALQVLIHIERIQSFLSSRLIDHTVLVYPSQSTLYSHGSVIIYYLSYRMSSFSVLFTSCVNLKAPRGILLSGICPLVGYLILQICSSWH